MSEQPEILDESVMAMVAARDLPDGAIVNLGLGLPLALSDYIPPDREVLFHSEQGIVGFGARVFDPAEVDPLLMNAGGEPVASAPGMSYMSHDESFAMIRGGHIDVTVLGALQVDAQGNLANAQIPGKPAPGLGGGQDLATCAKQVLVVMRHVAPNGDPKIVERCDMVLTALGCVDRVVTDVGLFEIADGRVTLLEYAPGWTVDQIQAITGAELAVAEDVREIVLI